MQKYNLESIGKERENNWEREKLRSQVEGREKFPKAVKSDGSFVLSFERTPES